MKDEVKNKIKDFLQSHPFVLKIFLITTRLVTSPVSMLSLVGRIISFPILYVLKWYYYQLYIFAINRHAHKNETNKTKKSSIFPETLVLKALSGDKRISVEIFYDYLQKEKIPVAVLFYWSQHLVDVGRLDLAKCGFLTLIERNLPMETRLHAYRYIGITSFLLGKNQDAVRYFHLAGQYRKLIFRPNMPKKYRILGPGWHAAIGHLCMIDYYLKYLQLYVGENVRVVAPLEQAQIPGQIGSLLVDKFKALGVHFLHPNDLEADYNIWAKKNGYPAWRTFTHAEREALVDDFWEYDFNDSQFLCFTHAIARIQKEWESAKRAPLFSLSLTEKTWVKEFLAILGVPKDAWYVCLHVREAGYHKKWNSLYPSMRDANILDYELAIETIVNAGGWVIRMGDASMQPLPPMKNVIDYAHSPFNMPQADILLAANCRFLLGTNSGYVNICSMYHVPCALTNWVPIGWPLWLEQDLMIPKLFRDKNTGKYLSLEQIFQTELAFVQNYSELPADIELVANTPEELAQVTLEMLARCGMVDVPPRDKTEAAHEVQHYYAEVAARYHSFTGPHLARGFTEKHKEIFAPSLQHAIAVAE